MKRLGLLFLLGGCSLPKEQPVSLEIQNLRVNVMELDDIQKLYYNKYGDKRVLGFADLGKREIYVPYGQDYNDCGQRMPDFRVLGHEVWHMQELGGLFHDNKCPASEKRE